MKSLSNYLITFSAIIYWAFRVIVSLMYSMGKEFICEPLNANLEIIILFLTIPSILFIIRRNVIGAILYFGMYTAYFGTIVYNNFVGISATGIEEGVIMNIPNVIANLAGIIIPLCVLLDITIQKSRISPKERKSDWYFENEKYDRKYDSRADRNNYKIK